MLLHERSKHRDRERVQPQFWFVDYDHGGSVLERLKNSVVRAMNRRVPSDSAAAPKYWSDSLCFQASRIVPSFSGSGLSKKLSKNGVTRLNSSTNQFVFVSMLLLQQEEKRGDIRGIGPQKLVVVQL